MRTNRLSWHDHNMGHAYLASLRSPDPSTQVGCYICTENNKPLSLGYNGTPRGIDPSSIPWCREANDPLRTKYPFIAHAEKNAVLNAVSSLEGAICYVTLFPCNDCAIELIQKGIKKIYYLENKYELLWQVQAAMWMLKEAGIETEKLIWTPEKMIISP